MKGLYGLFLLFVAASSATCLVVHESWPCASGRTSCYRAGDVGLTEEQRQGRDTWYFWTGGDLDADGTVVGDQVLWRKLAVSSHGTFDLLQAIDSRFRGERFQRFGVISDPDCTKATHPDPYGFWIDDCTNPDIPKFKDIPGEPTGVIGLRRFLNPRFDSAAWDLEKYKKDPASVEPPYLIGMSCAFCHVSFSPLHPPKDPENPEWRNLHPGIGNQFLREQLFNTAKYPLERGLKESDFQWQVAQVQAPGTSDTSQVATDHINNPGTMNNIVYLNARPMHDEITADGVPRRVYDVLKDGADSVGAACLDDSTEAPGKNDTACAAMRGYLNIGVCAAIWTTLHDPVYGLKRKQAPFHPAEARKKDKACDEGYTATTARMGGLEAFLRMLTPLHLADAEEGAQYTSQNAETMRRGKLAFAGHCARCHSSKQPPAGYTDSQVEWYRNAVLRDDFLTDNFLSDDVRHPVTEIGTNIGRAMASNATRGMIWEDFSSETYKEMPAVHVAGLKNPLHSWLPDLSVDAAGGRGYYRTPTLANIWATAPFFHNNALGLFNNDPSVAGRLVAYEDAMRLLLWPKRRGNSIPRTTQASTFQFPEGGKACIARNTPVDVIANVRGGPPALLRRDNLLSRTICGISSTGMLNGIYLLHDTVPDFVQDRGHTFGAEIADEDKFALIEYMKTF